MKLIVAGSRKFNDYDLLKNKLNYFLQDTHDEIIIISGGAKGADHLGEQYAIENGCKFIRFVPDWDEYGKKAGYIRNEQMASNATHCVVFWDGASRGSKLMIDLAKKYNLVLWIVKIS